MGTPTTTKKTRTITFEGMEFETASEAIQHYYASGYGDRVISLGGKHYLVKTCVAERVAAAGLPFAYVFDHDQPNGKNVLVSVPVND